MNTRVRAGRHQLRHSQRVQHLVQLSVAFQLEVEISQEADGSFPAIVKPLGIATFGTSLDDAVAQVQDAVESYVRSLAKHGELVSEFERLGVEFTQTRVVTRGSDSPYFEIEETTKPVRPARGFALLPCG